MVQPDYNENFSYDPRNEAVETYQTLEGAADDKGPKYEYLCTLLYTLQLAFTKTVKYFKISTNNKSYPSFDDVILELTKGNNTEETYAIQLKHGQTEASSNFAEGDLASWDKGKKKNQFCFRKYFNSFKQFGKQRPNLKLILYTNKEFKPIYKEDENNEIELKFFDPASHQSDADAAKPKKPYIIKIVKHDKCILHGILNTSTKQNGFIYKLKIGEDDHEQVQTTRLQLTYEEFVDYQNFFDIFYIYASQLNVDELKELILEKQKIKYKLEEKDDVHIFEKYHRYIKDWCCDDERVKVKLSRSVVEAKIVDTILSPYVKPKSNLSFEDKFQICKMCALDPNSSDKKIDESKDKTVDELWGKLELDDKIRLVREAILSFNVTLVDEVNDSIDKIWGGEEESVVPTILQLDASKIELINLMMKLQKTRYVLTGENISNWHADEEVFQNLNDLKKVNPEVFSNILDKFRCDFQGRKSVTLREITNDNNDILNAIHIRHILRMLFDPNFSIGDRAVDIPNPPFINRRIPKLIIDLDSLQKSENDIFVISRNGRAMNYNKLSNNVMILEQTTKKKFEEICAKHRNQNVHRLDLIEDFLLEWISTTYRKHGTVGELEKNTKYFVKDSEVLAHFQNNVNGLIAGSGMGKSTMFHYFKRHAPTNFWPIRIDLMMAFHHFNKKRKPKDILRDLMGMAPDDITSNIRNVYEIEKKILIFLDGIDCLKTEDINSVIAGIKVLAQLDCPIWIAAKHHLKDKLEKEFGFISLTLTSAGQFDQEQYITQRLKGRYSLEDVGEIIDLANKSKGLRDMFEIPITLFMFTEVWLGCVETPKRPFTVTDLYQSFIDARLDFYFSKTDIGNANSLTRKIIEFQRELHKEVYVKAALKTCFDVDCRDSNYLMLLKTIREEVDEIGFITNVNEQNVPVFAHQTYAEFLAASYLVKDWKNNRNVLGELFKEKHSNVRYMFDMLMAKECPAHLAVLERNLGRLKDVEEINVDLDKGGRNALHIACSWGVRHPLLNTIGEQRIAHSQRNTYDNFVSVPDEDPVYIQIIDKLLSTSNTSIIWDRDKIFKWNIMDYADHSLSLAAIDTIAGFTDIKKEHILNLYNFKDINSILSYAIKFDYKNLWQLIEPKPFFSIEPHLVHTPLALIIHYNRTDFLEEILENIEYLEHIDDLFHDRSLLQYALKNGYVDLAKILIDKGANINAEYLGEYPLLMCIKKHYIDLAKYLITHCKVDMDVVDRAGRNVLYLASHYGLISILEILEKSWLRSKVNTTKDLLYIVIRERRFDIFLFLIDNGFDVTRVDDKGRNALNLAIKFQDKDLLNNEQSILRYILNIEKFNIDAPDETSYCNTPLEQAIMKNDVSIVKLLLDMGCDALTKEKDYLQFALNHNQYEVAEYLITSGKFGIRLSEEMEHSHLDRAIKKRQIKAVILLLKHRADVSNLEKIRNVAFQLVKGQWGRSRGALYYLLKNYGDDMIHIRDEMQNTLLHCCVKNGALETAALLIDRKAPVTPLNSDGKNLIHLAVESNRVRMVEIILEQSGMERKINDKDNSGQNALHGAIKKGNLEVIKLLLDNGADINSLDGGGRNVLQQAARKKHVAIFDFLMSKVNFSLEDRDNSGNTVLYYAVAISESFHIVQQLIRKGARIDAVNKMHMNLLHAAADGTSLFTVKYLVEVLKFNPNKTDKADKRPIDKCYDVEIFKYLLENTDDLDIGCLLRNAVQRMYCYIVEYLASREEFKQYIDDVDENGNSALHLLMFQRATDKTKKDMKSGAKYFKFKFSHCLKHLIEGGGNVALENYTGDTPLSLAHKGNHEVALHIFNQYKILYSPSL